MDLCREMQTSLAVVQASWPQASCVVEAFCPYKEAIYVRSKPFREVQDMLGWL